MASSKKTAVLKAYKYWPMYGRHITVYTKHWKCFINLDGILRIMASAMDCQFVSQSRILRGNNAFARSHVEWSVLRSKRAMKKFKLSETQTDRTEYNENVRTSFWFESVPERKAIWGDRKIGKGLPKLKQCIHS
jgi:hypothetical protein